MHLSSNGQILRFTDANAPANNRHWHIATNLDRHLRFQAIDDSTLNNGDGAGGGNLFDFYREDENINEFRGVGAGNTWFTIDNRSYIAHVLGNVGIGTTDVDVEVGVANTGILAAGIVTAYSIYGNFRGTIDTGVAIDNANYINITDDTSGSGLHYIHFGSANEGYDGVEVDSGGLVYKNDKVGIGLDDPLELLHVEGNIRIGTNGALKLLTYPVVSYINNYLTTDYAVDLGSTGDATMKWTRIFGGGSEIAAFDGSTGNVGIGTSGGDEAHPDNTTLLNVGIITANYLYGTFRGDIDSGVPITNALNVNITDYTTGSVTHYIHFGSESAGYDGVEADSTGLVYKDDKVLIGTATESTSKLLVYGTSTSTRPATIYQSPVTGTGANKGFYVGSDYDDANGYVWNYENQPIVFATNNTENLRITSNGDVGIGTGVPTDEVGVGNTAVLAVGIVTAYKLYGDGSNITGVSGGEWSQDAEGNLTAGLDAGKCLTTNSVYNIFAGENSGSSVDTGDANIFLGHSAGNNTTSGSYNIFLGCYSGSKNVGGAYNIAFGDRAGCCLGSGNDNIFIGRCSGRLATGVYNTFFGSMSGCTLVSGCHNVHIGYKAGHDQTAGCCNVIIGSSVVTPPPTTNDNSRLVIGNPGGVWLQGDGSFNVGIGTYVPTDEAHVSNTKILSVGIVTANHFYGNFTGPIEGVTLSTYSSSFTASAGVAVGIDTFAKSDYDTAEYTIYFSNGSNIQSQKVLVMDDNTTAFSNEYALMYNTSQIVNISADVDGSNIKLKATPLAGVSGATSYTWSRTLL